MPIPSKEGAAAFRVGTALAIGLASGHYKPNHINTKAPRPIEVNQLEQDRISHLAMLSKTVDLVIIREKKFSAEPKKHHATHNRTSLHPHVVVLEPLPNILRRIGGCESAGSPTAPINYRAENPDHNASGGFQEEIGTWNDAGGYRMAMDAPPALQIKEAEKLYAARGTEPWVSSESCWG